MTLIYNLAADFGASSGRLILSKFDGDKIELEEIHRFSNDPVRIGSRFYWDFPRLFHELKNGLKKAALKGIDISGIGIDTWGVDYGLIDKNGDLLSNPIHYRDNRTDNIIDDIEKIMSFEEIYKVTGIQYLQLNTLYQLYADLKFRPDILEKADALLFMPDLFNFYLTGQKYNEYTIASTSQMLEVFSKTWALEMLEKLSLPTKILQKIIMPGNIIGKLTKDIQEETGLPDVPVMSVGSHDTASAVAATPLEGENCAYISSGTWSLLGVESKEPIVNEDSLKDNFTNEGGLEGRIRFLKNINGLWMIQQLKKHWQEHGIDVGYGEISKAAAAVKNDGFIIDPNDKSFLAPLNMATAVQQYCINNGQGEPREIGEIARAVYNGLAREYKARISNLEEITGRKINVINMVGGGIQDEFLCQHTANITGKTVLAGPIEATALGNILAQLIALGEINDLSQGREIVKNSITQKKYTPQ
ncbi:rhamnulokinase [Biomaibacter acetigenes]|uniref:Rhamnulokinase n=1 Tax=Biomaibacter acetigenes TaxID=2316383 RepID=A0A3G2R482_9FIRM|nr:rhamnulokinase family protein [Biomaibacter acetigenes]AYO30145.1 rhamnulokinase [Biomaibacter acetigenes]